MNPAAFFAAVRKSKIIFPIHKLTQRNVDGLNALLNASDCLSLNHRSHVFGEVYHETSGGIYPIKETVMPYYKDQNPSDAEVIRRLDIAFAAGKLKGVRRPYWREGWFGRGMIQITHEENYRVLGAAIGVDLVKHPEKTLELETSARIAVIGCERGLFRKYKLSDYDLPGGEYDHFNARNIVNGLVRSQATAVASYAKEFEVAFRAGGMM